MYLKTGGVVTLLESDVDTFEDFSFSSTRFITSCEFSSISVSSHCSTFPLSLAFPVERMIDRRTSCITSSSV